MLHPTYYKSYNNLSDFEHINALESDYKKSITKMIMRSKNDYFMQVEIAEDSIGTYKGIKSKPL